MYLLKKSVGIVEVDNDVCQQQTNQNKLTKSVIADIPHCRVHCCEYSAVKPFIRYPQEFEQLLMLFGQIQYQRSLPGDEEHVNPHKIVKDPPRCRILYGGALLVRKGGSVVLEGIANAILQRRIDEQADRHHHQERHDPRGLFEIQRRGQKAWIFEEAKATFRMHLAFIAL